MSEQDLDKLFRNKLEDLQKKPSTDAWQKIQAANGNQGWPWLRIAAAAALLISAAMFTWWIQSDLTDNQIAINSVSNEADSATTNKTDDVKNRPSDQDVVAAKEADSKTLENTKESTSKPGSQPVERIEKQTRQKEVAQKAPVDDIPASKAKDLVAVAEPGETVVPLKQQDDEEPAADVTIPARTTAQIQGTTLSFSIDDFDASEKTVSTSAETADNENGLKKVWGILKQVKEPETGLGELRDLKNNILAFGKDKNETE